MTVVVHVGRRVPKSWARRYVNKVKGLMTFQENIWHMITTSFSKARKAARKDGRLFFNIEKVFEDEDFNFRIEWRKITIQGPRDMEVEEYDDSMKMYDRLESRLKKDFPVDKQLSKMFKTKVLPERKVSEAYNKGYGAVKNKSMSDKLLEMGVLTHVEFVDDFEGRDVRIDF